MARIAAFLAFVTACSALKTEPASKTAPMNAPQLQPDIPGDVRQLGQTGKATTDATNWQLGVETAKAELAAMQAREDAAKALEAEGTDAQISEKEMAGQIRHAEVEVHTADHEEAMLNRVVDSMEHEVDVESRAVDTMEDKFRRLSGEVRKDLGQRIKHDLDEDSQLSGDLDNDPSYQREEKAERRLEKELAQEEGQEAKLLASARRQVDSAMAKEKMYLHHRAAVEHETQIRLADEADTLLKEAMAKGPLSEVDTLQLLDIAAEDLGNITSVLAGFAKQPPQNMTAIWIEEKLDGSRSKLAIASAKMLEAIKHKVETFKNNHLDYDNHQFLALLVRTLNEAIGEVRSFEEAKDYQMSRLQGWDKANGEKLTLSLAQAIHKGMTGSVEFRSHFTQIDTARLANLQMSEACGFLTDVVFAAMAPAYQSLAHHMEKLDNMSRITPTVTAHYPTFVQDRMGARAAALLKIAYVENLALKEAATSIMQEASPVVMDRLHCTMHSASARSGFGAAILVAVTAWLAQ